MKLICVSILSIFILGCASNFDTRPYDAKTDSGKLNGIKYYEAALVQVHYEFTVLTDKDGTYRGSSTDKPPGCKQVVQKEELAVWPDMTNPRVVENNPSIFSSTTFGVTFSNGMLTGVNAASAPQTATLLAPFLTAAAAGITALSVEPSGGGVLKACNASPVITWVKPVASFTSLEQ